MARISRFQPNRPKRKAPWRLVAISILILGILAEVYYGLVFAGYLRVRSIAVKGDGALPIAAVQDKIAAYQNQKLLDIFPRNHIFFANAKGLEAMIAESFLKVGQAEISFNFEQRELQVLLTPRKELAVWCAEAGATECFYVDNQGVAFAASPKTSGVILPSFLDARGPKLSLGVKVVEPSELVTLLTARQALINSDNKFESIKLRPSRDFVVKFQPGFEAWFSLDDPPGEQVARLNEVLKRLIVEKVGELEYIDLRVGNKVFYRFRGVVE